MEISQPSYLRIFFDLEIFGLQLGTFYIQSMCSITVQLAQSVVARRLIHSTASELEDKIANEFESEGCI